MHPERGYIHLFLIYHLSPPPQLNHGLFLFASARASIYSMSVVFASLRSLVADRWRIFQIVGAQRTHCFLQSLYALLIRVSHRVPNKNASAMRITHWKKSLHIALSPPLRFKHRMLLSAAS